MELIGKIIKKRRWNFWDMLNILRLGKNKQSEINIPESKRKRDGPKETWRRMSHEVGLTSWSEATKAMKD
jgi:hypothetical protein